MFSLNIKDLSEVYHVGRPTIYSWLDEDVEKDLRSENMQRLKMIYGIVKHIQASLGKSDILLKRSDKERVMIILRESKIKISTLENLLTEIHRENLDAKKHSILSNSNLKDLRNFAPLDEYIELLTSRSQPFEDK
jgi:hypothetical protein